MVLTMFNFSCYAALMAILGLVGATLMITIKICPTIDVFDGLSHNDRVMRKIQYSVYTIVVVTSCVCFMVTFVKRREFFSIVAPIFIGMSSTLWLLSLLT